jgi:hypothetical protein
MDGVTVSHRPVIKSQFSHEHVRGLESESAASNSAAMAAEVARIPERIDGLNGLEQF